MGCDIHCYVEHRRKGRKSWDGFGGRINPGRNYGMFSVMADVRSYGESVNLFQPRGMPTDTAYYSSDDNRLYVSDINPKAEGCCSTEQAEDWVKGGASFWLDDKRSAVSHPDWHSHSWVTLDEYKSCVKAFSEAYPERGLDDDYYGLLGAMAAMEAKGCEVRMVFWFDN